MGARKPFDKELFKENNEAAIWKVVEYLTETAGLFATPNDELYAPDIIVFNGFRKAYYVEVEVKHGWKPGQESFPFSTVNLPERKGKYLKLRTPIEYWILRSDMGRAIILPDYLVSSSPLVEVPNRLVESGELFYQVPTSECIIKEF